MRFLGGVLFGILIIIIAAVVVAATGSYNVAATSPPGKFEQKVATFTLSRSISKRALTIRNPFPVSADVLRPALAHYKENCVMCHGAPGVEESEAGQGLNPPAPDLTLHSVQKMTDGELFWVVSNGIRMTGMPAFSPTHQPDEIWKMVAFVRHLPEITNEEQKALKAGSEEEAHHREEEAESPQGKGGPVPAKGPTPHTHPAGTEPHRH